MKNMKMATKLSVMIIIVMILGLGILWFITNQNMKATISDSTKDRMNETTQARSLIIENYVANAEKFLKGYVQAGEIQALFEDNGSTEAIATAQAYTEQYAALDTNIENIYIANTESLVYVSLAEATRGIVLREGEELNALTEAVFASTEVYNIGIIISPASGEQVLSMYYPIYDTNGHAVGFAGIALKASELLDSLNQITFEGLENCRYMILDVNNRYIYNEDSSKIGVQVADTNLLRILNKTKSDTTGKIYETVYKNNGTGKDIFTVYKNIPNRKWIFLIQDEASEVYASVKEVSITLAVICVSVLAVVVILVGVAVRLISRNLRKVCQVIQEVGTLDLTTSTKLVAYQKRKDEVGMIAKATMHLVQAMSSAFIELKNESAVLYEESKNLLQISKQSVESVQQVDDAVQDVAKGATSQAEETQRATNEVMIIGNMVEETTQESDVLHKNASNMRKASEEVVTTLEQLNESNTKTEESIDVIREQTNVTNESVMKIQKVTAMIASIADETSLLSLNASIEAARAGEQGRGFAVVATQIQQLAEQSNQSVAKINTIIESLVTDSTKSVEIMKQVQEVIHEQSDHVNETIAIFEQLQTGIHSSIDGVRNISKKTEQMDEARRSVIDVVSNLSAIAEENAASAEETSASANVVSEMMSNIETASNRLSEVAEKIDQNIHIFKLAE